MRFGENKEHMHKSSQICESVFAILLYTYWNVLNFGSRSLLHNLLHFEIRFGNDLIDTNPYFSYQPMKSYRWTWRYFFIHRENSRFEAFVVYVLNFFQMKEHSLESASFRLEKKTHGVYTSFLYFFHFSRTNRDFFFFFFFVVRYSTFLSQFIIFKLCVLVDIFEWRENVQFLLVYHIK